LLRRFRCNYRGCLIVFNVLKAAWLRHFPCCAYIDGAVAPVEDDGVDFAQRMKEIHKELLELQAESNRLMETISKNLEEMGV